MSQTTPDPEGGADPGGAAHARAVDPPPATPCWLALRQGGDVGGTVLGWQQHPDDGSWWALVAAWVPREAVRRR